MGLKNIYEKFMDGAGVVITFLYPYFIHLGLVASIIMFKSCAESGLIVGFWIVTGLLFWKAIWEYWSMRFDAPWNNIDLDDKDR